MTLTDTTRDTLDRLCEIARADAVNVGDEILVPRIGLQLIAEVDRYDDRIVITYFAHEESTFENRARDRSGMNTRKKLVLKELAWRHPADTVLIVRGSAGAAATMRERLERDQAERWHSKHERQERAESHRLRQEQEQ